MSNVAQTLFETGPKDELATADVYGRVVGALDSEIEGVDLPEPEEFEQASKEQKQKVMEKAKESDVSAEDMENAADAGLIGKNDAALAERALAALDIARRATLNRRVQNGSGSVAAYNALPRDLKDKILYDLSNGAFGDSAAIETTVGGVVRKGSRTDLESASSISDFLVDLTGNEDIAEATDLQAQMAVFNGVLKQAIDIGAVDAIDTLWERARDKERAREMLIQSLRSLAITSSLDGINKVIGYVGVHGALSREPDLVQYILTFYKIPQDKGRVDYDSLFTELITLLDRLDSNWSRYNRDGSDVSNTGLLAYASRDALTLFKREQQWFTLAMVAPSHPSRHLRTLARRNYPRVAVF